MKNNIYRETFNFFRNQFFNIMLLVLIVSLINIFLYNFLSFSNEQFIFISKNNKINIGINTNLNQKISQLSLEQQKILLKNSIARTLTNLINNVLLTGGLLTMINMISSGKKINIFDVMIESIYKWPCLFLLIFNLTIIIQLGFILFIPGILFAVIFSLSIIIIFNNKFGIIKSMILSAKLTYKNINLIVPIISYWLFFKIFLLILINQRLTTSSNLILTLLFNILNNLSSVITIIYLYRTYYLINKH